MKATFSGCAYYGKHMEESRFRISRVPARWNRFRVHSPCWMVATRGGRQPGAVKVVQEVPMGVGAFGHRFGAFYGRNVVHCVSNGQEIVLKWAQREIYTSNLGRSLTVSSLIHVGSWTYFSRRVCQNGLSFYAKLSNVKVLIAKLFLGVTIRWSRANSFFVTNPLHPCVTTILSLPACRLDGTKSLMPCKPLNGKASNPQNAADDLYAQLHFTIILLTSPNTERKHEKPSKLCRLQIK